MEEDPFDFESDALLATTPVLAPKRRKKVIGLDDLLVDHYREKNSVRSKLAKTKRTYDSDDEEDGIVFNLSKYVDECHEKINQLGEEDDVSVWGLQVFGNQKTMRPFVFDDLSSCSLFHSVMNHEANSLVELSIESGETFFEGLLKNGWLLKLVSKCGEVEKSIAKWTFHLMLYSSKEVVRSAAVNFWSDILSLKNEHNQGGSKSLKIDWLPSFSEIKDALETYGFIFHSPTKEPSAAEMVLRDSECMGPPQNIVAWIEFVSASSHARNMHFIFSTMEAEQLLAIIIRLLLDRGLLGLSLDLNKCMLSLVNFFNDEEWSSSITKVATTVASRVPLDINSLRAVECIPAVSPRNKQLRSSIAYRILLGYFDNVEDEEEVTRQLTLIDLKEKSCDLFRIYIYLVLTENWFLYDPVLRSTPLLKAMWGLFLRNCSCQINIADTRSYASKVRSKASYLLQGTN